MSRARLAGDALLALAVAGMAGIGYVLLFAPPAWSLGALVGDDAGYYFAIARNHGLGFGFSFDRIHPTNGFNPLYPWLLIPLYRLLPADLPLLACYRVGVLTGYLAMAISLVVFFRMLAASLDRAVFPGGLRRLALGAGAAFFVLFVATKSYYGMDAPLVLLLGVLYLRRLQQRGPLAPGARAAVLDGLLLGFVFLARVDTLPLVAAAVAFMGLEALARRAGAGAIAGRLLVMAGVCLPYLVWSVARFGTWLPVSASLKSSFPVLDPARSLEAIRHTSLNAADQASFAVAYLLAWGTAVALAPALVRAVRDGRALEPRAAALGVLALYLIGRLSYMLLFSRTDVQGSYAILAHVFNVFAALAAVEALARRGVGRPAGAPVPVGALAGAGLALLALVLFAGKLQATTSRQALYARGVPDEWRLAREIHDRTAPGDVLYGGACGIMGFVADRPWINGDGVVNTYDYQRAFLEPGEAGEGGLRGYLRANRVTHVVFLQPPGHPGTPELIPVDVRGLLHDRVNRLQVRADDVLLCRRTTRAPEAEFCLARYRP